MGRAPTRCVVAALALATACTTWRRTTESPADLVARDAPPPMRVTLANHARVELWWPRIEGDSLRGAVRVSRAPVRWDTVAIPLSDVRSVEVRKLDGVRTALLVAGVGLTVWAIAAAEASTPEPAAPRLDCDTCGFSCPLVYSWDGARWRLDSGTFGGAILPTLARTDADNLDFLAPDADGRLRLRVANELVETDYVDAVALWAVDHEPGMTVAPDADGRLHAVVAPVPPVAARDFDGRDALARVRDADGWNWESTLAVRDTADPARLRDGLVLEFPRPSGVREARLVVDGRNTPWAAYLMYRFVAAHGEETDAWFRRMAADPAAARALGARFAREAFLAVSVWTRDGWRPQGLVWEAGPEISKRQVLVLDLSGVEGAAVRVRLESVPSFWLIDRVALDTAAPRPFHVRALAMESAVDGNGRPVAGLLSEADGRHLVLETGDAAELVFRAPALEEGQARTYVLRSTGWYRIRTPEAGPPERALLARIEHEPSAVSRLAVAEMNRALGALER